MPPHRPPQDRPPGAALAAAARDLCGARIGWAWADPGHHHPLWPGEALDGAVPRRAAEFSAGRAAARQAMAALGLPPAALPVGRDRAPVWPEAMVGSISHSRTACLAAVARRADHAGLGIDIEAAPGPEPAMWPSYMTDAERAALPSDGVAAQSMAFALFSAKEAAFKAQGGQVGFRDIAIGLDLAGGRFEARFPPVAGHAPPLLEGRIAVVAGHVLAVVARPA
ncbi:4'-phosphopantetheinyl transferase family protein [Roseicyclus persicicus]|uniref:Enterobactin synthase component D n=1 Tax=Roseicyclus persicicus TaxID=2650661 RepID=A0A7X6GZJ8_9RHOB|nr:4'-phosphopantetheinyl transferase superfamily protein [Roseibacterium persicicum]NKX44002.1 4'-phosphopantetheinyl transferase superfamily protein [Roseibacterium persicicum]